MAQRGRPPTPGILTPAEERVLDHVRQGQSNAEIAVRLGISVNTVRYHVSNLLSKAGVSERGDLGQWQPSAQRASRAWRKRPSWLWLAFAGAGATGLAVAAAIALVVPSGVDDPAVDLPAGYRVYEAAELEAMGMVDVGPLFEMEDGSEPVLGTELRGAVAAVVVREGAAIRLMDTPGIVYPPRSASRSFVLFDSPHAFTVVVFAQETLFEAESGDVLLAPAGRTGQVGVEARVRGSEAPYATAVDTRGHLFVSPGPFEEDTPLDYDTRRALHLSDSEQIADVWLPGAVQVSNFCDDPCFLALYTNEMMTAPVSGTLSACSPDGSQLLQAEGYSLRFRRQVMVIGGTQSRCDGEGREVAAGDELGYPGRWLVTAQTVAGEPLDLGRSSSGALYVGERMKPEPSCPCMGRR